MHIPTYITETDKILQYSEIQNFKNVLLFACS